MNPKQIGFSYYELSLLSFLMESHPDRFSDVDFIKNRAAEAAEAYAEAFDNGENIQECTEIANQTLYSGLHFSKHDTITTILWSEYTDLVPPDEAKKIAVKLQPILEYIFAKYTLSDDFAQTPEFQLLYTELTGAIQLKFEGDGI